MDNKMTRYKLTEADLLRENGHVFVDVAKLGLSHSGKCCLNCGIMRRVDGQNKPCKGHVGIALREQQPEERGNMDCGCKKFCETHGRDEIAVDAQGVEFCGECAADGWSGELCAPAPSACHMDNDGANEFERGFMCSEHAEKHHAFCAECVDEAA